MTSVSIAQSWLYTAEVQSWQCSAHGFCSYLCSVQCTMYTAQCTAHGSKLAPLGKNSTNISAISAAFCMSGCGIKHISDCLLIHIKLIATNSVSFHDWKGCLWRFSHKLPLPCDWSSGWWLGRAPWWRWTFGDGNGESGAAEEVTK